MDDAEDGRVKIWNFSPLFTGSSTATRRRSWARLVAQFLFQSPIHRVIDCNSSGRLPWQLCHDHFSPLFTGSSTATRSRSAGCPPARPSFQSPIHRVIDCNPTVKDMLRRTAQYFSPLFTGSSTATVWVKAKDLRPGMISVPYSQGHRLQRWRTRWPQPQRWRHFSPLFTGSSTATRDEIDDLAAAEAYFSPLFTGSSTATSPRSPRTERMRI